jgi:hypothetical protein
LLKKESVTFETCQTRAIGHYKFKGRTFFSLKPNLQGILVVSGTLWIKENIPLEKHTRDYRRFKPFLWNDTHQTKRK